MNQLSELFCGYTMIVWLHERLLIVFFQFVYDSPNKHENKARNQERKYLLWFCGCVTK
jgi:hypothetical protein